jgi:hypothetical protein
LLTVPSPTGSVSLKQLHPVQYVLLAAPLLWVVIAFVHPAAEPYEGIAGDANRWIFVHVAQLVLTPFLAMGVWMLLLGIESVAATFTRVALAFWMVFFSAFDAIAGIATGVLTRHANSLTGQDRDGVVAAIEFLWGDSQLAKGGFSVLAILGQGTWIVVAIAATLTLYHARARRAVVVVTLISVLFAAHAGFPAAVGLVALFVAELLRFGTRSGEPAPRAAPEPT